jgi:hypothetical protein
MSTAALPLHNVLYELLYSEFGMAREASCFGSGGRIGTAHQEKDRLVLFA